NELFPLVKELAVDSNTTTRPCSLSDGLRFSDCSGVLVRRVTFDFDATLRRANANAATKRNASVRKKTLKRSTVRLLIRKFSCEAFYTSRKKIQDGAA